jgi:glycosyltransferase involved in cell wall biosynthesis
VRVCVLTTSYPRFRGDAAGAFVAELVERLRGGGVEVTVASPADFRHYGIAYGAGIPQNLRARPWLVLALPLFLAEFVRAARRAARGADVVHAHWLPSALPALATGKPVVLQLWGSDAAYARRLGPLVRPLLRRAACVVGASEFLAAQARALGAARVAVVPFGVEAPERVEAPEEPSHVLYVGRLSEEKGVLEFLEASAGLPRVVVGDGPLRTRVPEATGFVDHDRLRGFYGRAAVVCVPSRREGYGIVAREAMAHGRPVVATRVGGLADAVEDGITGLLVTPGATDELRSALRALCADRGLAARLGANGRERALRDYSWPAATAALLRVYAEVSGRTR